MTLGMTVIMIVLGFFTWLCTLPKVSKLYDKYSKVTVPLTMVLFVVICFFSLLMLG